MTQPDLSQPRIVPVPTLPAVPGVGFVRYAWSVLGGIALGLVALQTNLLRGGFPAAGSGWQAIALGLAAAAIGVGLGGLLWRGSRWRRALHEALDRQQWLEQAVELGGAGVVVTDPEGTILHANTAACSRSGYARHELVGSNPRVLQSGWTPPESYQAMWEALREGRPWSGVLFNRRKDGSNYVEQTHVRPVQRAGGALRYLSVSDDVTARREASRALERQREQLLQMLERAKSELLRSQHTLATAQASQQAQVVRAELVGATAQEVRAPLAALQVAAQRLRQTRLDGDQAGLVEAMQASAAALMAALDDLADLSRIAAGAPRAEMQPLDLRAWVEGVCAPLATAAQARGVQFALQFDAALPRHVMADAPRLHQVLVPIVEHAIRACSGRAPEGRVALRVEPAPDTRLCFTVTDNGAGLDDAGLAQLFEPAGALVRAAGDGPRLALARQIVGLMDGLVEARSAPGQGTSIEVLLPLVAAAPATPPGPVAAASVVPVGPEDDVAPPAPPSREQGPRVLVAEGNPIHRLTLHAQLADLGVSATLVGDGAHALQRWRAGGFALLLADLRLPGIDGLELARRIRAAEGDGPRRPLLALAAEPGGDDGVAALRDTCLEAGLDELIVRPAPPGALAAALARWLPLPEPIAPQPALADAPVILVDGDAGHRDALRSGLADLGARSVHMAADGPQALARLAGCNDAQALMLVELELPGMDGVELMRSLADMGYRGALALFSEADRRLLESGARLAAEHGLNLIGHLGKPVQPRALRTLVDRWRSHLQPPLPRRPGRLYGPDEVRRALDDGELRLHYQPKVRIVDGTLAGVEALLRWKHPRDGVVLPDCFVPVAEENGLIDGLTTSVLAIAMDQARAWRERGLQIPVAVNVSMDNLVRLDFPDRVLAMLAERGLNAGDLSLEVTESRLLKDPRVSLDILARLRLHRIGLAVDDFGTGHSSLAQLRDLPFDELKIDRGFVHGCTDSATQRAIVAASVEMAHQLGMRTVAEGVEDIADWHAVREAGCDVVQGWFIARPMDADLIPGWAEGFARRFAAIG